MNGLAWLNDLMVWLGRWVPRLILIQPTHRGVSFGPSGQATLVGPGVVLYWPITHVIVEVPITTQSIQICAQLLPIPDEPGEPAVLLPRVKICAAAVQFRVVDAVAAAVQVLNLHALIDNRTSAAITRHVDLSNDRRAWSDVVRSEVSEELIAYGVEVHRLDFTQYGVGVALKNISDWSYSDSAEGKRPA